MKINILPKKNEKNGDLKLFFQNEKNILTEL